MKIGSSRDTTIAQPRTATNVVATTSGLGMTLPDIKSTPSDQFGDYSILVFGEKKIGKTSLCAQFPDALFLMFEPGGKGLEIYQQQIGSWAQFKEMIKLLKSNPDRFKTVVIDTIDIAYDVCMKFVGQRNGFEHPSEKNDFGKSWSFVENEFINTIKELVQTGRGVVFISHAKESEFIEATGKTYNKIIPTMSNQASRFVSGFVDVIAYYGYYGQERRLTIAGSDTITAGHRIDRRFWVKSADGVEPDQRVYSIPMGESPKSAYDNLLKAFNNEQTETFKPERESKLSEAKKKPMGK